MTQRRANDDIAQIPELSDEVSLDEQPHSMEQPQAPDSDDNQYTVMLRVEAVKQNLNSAPSYKRLRRKKYPVILHQQQNGGSSSTIVYLLKSQYDSQI
jgi:hypothetical protein